MYVPIEKLIDGIVGALRNDVLPEVAAAPARARLWAALDILNNLRDRVEEKPSAWAAEAESAQHALRTCAAELRSFDKDAAAAIEESVDRALRRPGDSCERAAAFREALVEAIRVLGTIDPESGAGARAALESHLSAQALRDVLALKPSLLSEISKG